MTAAATAEEIKAEEKKLPAETNYENKKSESFYDFLSSFADQNAVRCELYRDKPREWGGKNTRGYITDYDGTDLTVDEIKETHGGGTFRVIIKTPAKSGKWMIRDQHVLQISGDPLIFDSDKQGAPSLQEKQPSMSEEAVKQAFEFADRATERAAAGQNNSGNELEVMGNLMERFHQSQENSNERFLEFMRTQAAAPKEDGASEKVFELMKTNLEGEGSRLTALKASHEAEMRQKEIFHQGQIERLQDRQDREMLAAREAAVREIESVKSSQLAASEAFKNGFEMRLEALKETIKRYERELEQKKGPARCPYRDGRAQKCVR
jgi:hypothetical protein